MYGNAGTYWDNGVKYGELSPMFSIRDNPVQDLQIHHRSS